MGVGVKGRGEGDGGEGLGLIGAQLKSNKKSKSPTQIALLLIPLLY